VKNGWQTKTLDEISTNLDSRRVPITKGVRVRGEYPYYGASGIVDHVADYIFDEDTLLVSEDGANLLARSTPIAFPVSGKYWVNNHAHILKFENLTTQRFVELYLESISLDDYITGAAQPKLNQKALNSIPIPAPPLPEQQRIVGILDEACEGIATAKANAEENLQNARALFESHLQSVFTQRGRDWVESTLGEVCDFIGGSQPPKSVFSKTRTTDNIRLIQIRDYKSDNHIVYIPRAQARRLCSADDVMIGRYGPPLFQILRGLDGAYNVALMKAVPDESKLSRDFLFYFLKHSTILQYIIYHSERAAGQIGVTKETLEPYPIALPSLAEQRKVVRAIAELESETECLVSIYERKLVALEALKKSLLHQAFAGQL
jgi:type I restriction enzyme, S subunit